MAWINLTVEHLVEGLAGAEANAVRTAALGAGQADPVTDVILGVVREIRGRVAACAENAVGEGETIPDELKDTAVAILVFRMCNRLPTKVLLNETRIKAYEDALRLLEAVAACRFAIAAPETETDEQYISITPSWSARDRRYSSGQQDGI